MRFREATAADAAEILRLYKSLLTQEGVTWNEEYPDETCIRDDLAERRFQLQIDQAQWLEDRERDLDELRRRFREVRDRDIFGQRRMLAAFPRLRSLDHRRALERLRRWLEQR